MAEISKMVIGGTTYTIKDTAARSGKAVSTTLGTSVDLDTVTTPGFYTASSINEISNKPSGIKSFGLTVTRDGLGEYYTQVLNCGDVGKGTCYRRVCMDGKWSGWKPVHVLGTVGSTTQPVYMGDGELKACSYTLGKSVPADAKFTDTVVPVDSALSSTSANPVQNKVVNSALGNKVDKVSGKSLSTNDFTTAYKTKLDGIESGANKYTLPTATATTKGGVTIGNTISATNGKIDAKMMTAGSTTGAGMQGIVPAPPIRVETSNHTESSSMRKYLNDNAEWEYMSKVYGMYDDGNDGWREPNNAMLGKSTMACYMARKTSESGDVSAFNGDNSYKSWLYMNPYWANDAGGATALGISRSNARTFVMVSDSGQKEFSNIKEVLTTGNETRFKVGMNGSVPAPAEGDTGKFLRGDGTWQAVSASSYTLPDATATTKGGVTIGDNISVSGGKISVPVASSSTAGVMSATDKRTLDKLEKTRNLNQVYVMTASEFSQSTKDDNALYFVV